MSRIAFVVFAGSFLIGCAGAGAADLDPIRPTASVNPIDDQLEQMAVEFRQLRAVPGHFGGGTWNDDVDRWMGRKHALMIELASRLIGGAYDKNTIVQLLDPPDQIARESDDLFDLIGSQPGYGESDSVEYLIYYWRGTHDFLFFVCRDGAVVGADWWYAGD